MIGRRARSRPARAARGRQRRSADSHDKRLLERSTGSLSNSRLWMPGSQLRINANDRGRPRHFLSGYGCDEIGQRSRIMTPNDDRSATAELRREEARVEARSGGFKKELGLADLALTQVLFIVGLPWIGVAAKQGPSHVVLWLLAMLFFYLPSAAVVIYLNGIMPLE